MIDSVLGRGRRRISPGVSCRGRAPRRTARSRRSGSTAPAAGVNGWPAAMLSRVAPRNVSTNATSETSTKRTYLREVVVELAALLDRVDDRGEVVVGQDHAAGVLRDLGAAAHRDADVGRLDRRRVVHAVARHRHDVALLLERVHEQHLVLRGDAADHADARRSARAAPPRSSAANSAPRIASPSMPSCSAIAAPVTTSSPVTMRTRMCALLRVLHRLLRLLARRVDHPDQARDLKVVHVAQQVAAPGRTRPGSRSR